MTIKQYVKQRDEAVRKNDLEAFKKFLKRAADEGNIGPKVYICFIKANETVQQATIHKMACNIIGMSKKRVKEAEDWLEAHNMSRDIFI